MQRRFVFLRDEDATGISGVGKVVEGVMYSDGRCAYRWMTEHQTDQAADSLDKLYAIHGHNGRTRIVFLDDEDGSPYPGVIHQIRALERASSTSWKRTLTAEEAVRKPVPPWTGPAQRGLVDMGVPPPVGNAGSGPPEDYDG